MAKNHLPVVKRGRKIIHFKKIMYSFHFDFHLVYFIIFLEFTYTKEFIISIKYMVVHILTYLD